MMKTQTKRTRFALLCVVMLAALAALSLVWLTPRTQASAAALPTTQDNDLQMVALYKTTDTVTVPNKLDTLDSTVDVTSVIEFKSTDTDHWMGGDAFYNNYPYIVFRKSADGNKVVAVRISRNGTMEVFCNDLSAGEVGSGDQLNPWYNAWKPHKGANPTNNEGQQSYSLKIESTATGAKFYNYGGTDVLQEVTFPEGFQNLPAVFEVNCSGGYTGYLSELKFSVNDTDMLDLQANTRLKKADGADSAFVVSNTFIDAATANAGQTYDILLGKKYIKNKTTGEYVKITDLDLEYTINYMDTKVMTGPNDWDVPQFRFFQKTDGTKIGVRLCRNGVGHLMLDGDVPSQVNAWRQHALAEQAGDGSRLFSYSFTVRVQNGNAKIRIGNMENDSDYIANAFGGTDASLFNSYVLGDGKYIFETGATEDSLAAVNGVTMRILSEGEYDYNDTIDAEYQSLIRDEDTEDTIMTYDPDTQSYSDDGTKTSLSNREKVTTVFDGISATEFTTQFSCTVTLDATPASVWSVPNIGFWQDTDGARYVLEARTETANTYVFKRETEITDGAQFGAAFNVNFLNGKNSYTVQIVTSKTQSGGKAAIMLDGSTFNVDLPAGKPAFELMTRGTACTFSNVKACITDVDTLESDPLVFATNLTMDTAPAAVKYNDELTGGAFTVTKLDGSQQNLTLTDMTVTGYDKTELDEQTVTFAYSDAYTTVAVTKTYTLADYATGVYVDAESECLYGEDCVFTLMAEMISQTAEIDVTAEAVLSGFNKNQLGEQAVTVTYTDPVTQESYSDTFDVTVVDYIAGIEASINKTEYEIGDSIGAVTVKVVWASGAQTDPEANSVAVSGFTSAAAGNVTVTVTYTDSDEEEHTDTLVVTVKAAQTSGGDNTGDNTGDNAGDNTGDNNGGENTEKPKEDGCGSAAAAAALPIAAVLLGAGVILLQSKRKRA